MTPAQKAALGQHGKAPAYLSPHMTPNMTPQHGPQRVMSPLAQGAVPDTPLPLPMDGQSGMLVQSPYPFASPSPKTFLDRIVDVIVGEEAGPTSKYALVCARCFAHNGLALPEELDDIKYVCPKCGFFNASRNQRKSGTPSMPHSPLATSRPTTPVPHIQTPEPEEGEHTPGHRPRASMPNFEGMSNDMETHVQRGAVSEYGDDEKPSLSDDDDEHPKHA